MRRLIDFGSHSDTSRESHIIALIYAVIALAILSAALLACANGSHGDGQRKRKKRSRKDSEMVSCGKGRVGRSYDDQGRATEATRGGGDHGAGDLSVEGMLAGVAVASLESAVLTHPDEGGGGGDGFSLMGGGGCGEDGGDAGGE